MKFTHIVVYTIRSSFLSASNGPKIIDRKKYLNYSITSIGAESSESFYFIMLQTQSSPIKDKGGFILNDPS